MPDLADEELLRRIEAGEDELTEFKEQGSTEDIRDTAVAFANSTPQGQTGVLFFGYSGRRQNLRGNKPRYSSEKIKANL